ncbi:MAG: hypothetical protein QM655_06265 [Nocardioidaceae bacterium]
MQTPSDTPLWTDEHSRAVSALEPRIPATSAADLDRLWARVQADLPDPGASRGRRTRLAIGAGAGIAALALGGVAAAGGFSAHTDRYPSDAEDLRLGGPGEYLDPAAPDYGQVIDAETKDIPFPSAEARRISREDEVRDGQRDEPGTSSVSTGAMRFWTARASVCSWANEWVAAKAAGDGSAEAQAATMLQEAPAWPAVTDVDSEQTMDYIWQKVRDEETGRTTLEKDLNNTPAGYFPLVRKAAHSDDVKQLASVLAKWGACDPELMPDFPQSIPPSLPRG